LWVCCALAHGCATLVALLFGAEPAWLLARASVALAHALTLLGVLSRLALHFPLVTAIYVAGLALCALLLALGLVHATQPRAHALK
jgi:hypothetical protein